MWEIKGKWCIIEEKVGDCMDMTLKVAFDLSLLAYFDPYDQNETLKDMIQSIKEDTQLQKDYQNDAIFLSNMEQLSKIEEDAYEGFYIRDIWDDNQQSGVVLYCVETLDSIILMFRGSEIYDHIHNKTGWQDWIDNFHMYLPGPTPQQLVALQYIQKMEVDKPLYLCGHSKGGNLALFILLTCQDEIFHKIQRVYAFNAPGITNSLWEAYEQRIQEEQFQNKVLLLENEHDCVSSFFRNVKKPLYIKSQIGCNTFSQMFTNHNLGTMVWIEGQLQMVQRKSTIPIMVDKFINEFVVKQSSDRLEKMVHRANDYFYSGLPLAELYRVFIFHVSKYTSFFDDLSYEDITTLTFHDLLKNRRSKILLGHLLENTTAALNEIDMKYIIGSILENYNIFKKNKQGMMQGVIRKNNFMILDKIKGMQLRNKVKKEENL